MATRFGVKDNTASELLKELQEKCLVERTPDGWRATAAGSLKVSTSNTPNQPK